MTKSELRELIGRVRSNKYLMRSETDYITEALKEVEQYRAIGTLEECRGAVERQKGLEEDKFDKMESKIHMEQEGKRWED